MKKEEFVWLSSTSKGTKTLVFTEYDIAKANAFLRTHSSEEFGDGMFLDCCCKLKDRCPRWEAYLPYVAKDVRVPKCLLKTFKAELGNLISDLERF